MSTISVTKLYDLLSTKLGKETAENLTTFIESKIKQDLESKTQHLATKEDLAKVKGDLETKIAETKSELIKWMFIFWIGQVVVTFGFLLIYLKN
jgi:hypothetical protein